MCPRWPASDTISGVTEPIFAQHTSEQVIRLNEGEASILGGILEKQDQVSWNGIPGLSSIPLVKYLFGSKDHTITEDEIVFLVVPHIMRSQELDPGESASHRHRHRPVNRVAPHLG